VSRVTIRVTGFPPWKPAIVSIRAASAADAKREDQMKRFILVTALLTFIAGTFAAIVPAAADKHGDRMRQDCKSGLRKC
jgi:hypothetical protein